MGHSFIIAIYVVLTNPLSHLEVIMQTNKINDKLIVISHAIKEKK